jgi:hypothetical protein
VDALELAAPANLRVGESTTASATVVQDDRRVPVGFPVSADWAGSKEMYIGPADNAPIWSVAAFDPSTGRLTALRPGQADLSVTVNGVSQTATLIITN